MIDQIRAVAAIAGIAYAVYSYLTPDFLDDFDDDFDDEFDYYFCDDEEDTCLLYTSLSSWRHLRI